MKRLLLFFLFLMPAAFAHAEPDSIARVSREMRIDSMLQKASSYLGVGYCRGGVNRNCFDCSGFIQRIFATFNYELPHSSAAMAKEGKHIKHKKDLMPGDLIFFKGRSTKSKHVGHVGMVVQNDGHSIIFIHASVSRGICFEELESSAYYKSRYLTARRIVN